MPERAVTADKAARAEMELTVATEARSSWFILLTITSNTLLRTLTAATRDRPAPEGLAVRLVSPAHPELAEIRARRCVGNTEQVGKVVHRKDLAVREDPGSPVPPDKEEMTELPASYRPKLAEAAAMAAVEEARAVTLTTGFSTYLTMVVRPGSYTIHGTPGVGRLPFNPTVRTVRT